MGRRDLSAASMGAGAPGMAFAAALEAHPIRACVLSLSDGERDSRDAKIHSRSPKPGGQGGDVFKIEFV